MFLFFNIFILASCYPLVLPPGSSYLPQISSSSSTILSMLQSTTLSPSDLTQANSTILVQINTEGEKCYPQNPHRDSITPDLCTPTIDLIRNQKHAQTTRIWTAEVKGLTEYWHAGGQDPCFVFVGADRASSTDVFSPADIASKAIEVFQRCGSPSYGGEVRVGTKMFPQGFYVGIGGLANPELFPPVDRDSRGEHR